VQPNYDPNQAAYQAFLAQQSHPAAQPPQQPYAPPAPQQQYPGAGGQLPPTTPPPLANSGGSGNGVRAPKMRHLGGRTIIIEPTRVDETAIDQQTKQPRPEAYFNLTVVDGGPLQFGDNQDRDVSKQHGNTHEIQTPCRFVGINSRDYGFVNEVRNALARGDVASVGVVEQGTKGNRPMLVTKCSTMLDGSARPDGDARYAAATQLWNAIFSKQFTSPEPRSLVATPAAPQQQVSYGAPVPQGPTYGTAGGPPQYATPAPAQYANYAPAGQQFAYGVPPQASPIATVFEPQQPAYAAGAAPQGPYGEAAAYNPMTSVPQTPAAQPGVDPAYAAWLAAQQGQQQPAPAGPGI
jgi:hypothetical protein